MSRGLTKRGNLELLILIPAWLVLLCPPTGTHAFAESVEPPILSAADMPEAPIPVAASRMVVRTFAEGGSGPLIDEVIVPGRPPKTYRAPAVVVPQSSAAAGVKILTYVPAFTWCYGCSATSAGMIMGYYDNHGYTAMYTGPANGGVCPMNNETYWGSTVYPSVTCGESPLVATHMGKDGRAIRGHVDDYWIDYDNAGPDPYIVNGWTEHTQGDCTGDYMGTNKSIIGNSDGSTSFYYYTNGAVLCDYTGCEPGDRDGCHGLRLFVESRGYTVVANCSQYIMGYNGNTQGFTFANYTAEIDAGRPVMIQVSGHTMVGFGYDTSGNTVYVHDTWDHYDHIMTWGGSYSGLQHYGVTYLRLGSPPSYTLTLTSSPSGGGTISANPAPGGDGKYASGTVVTLTASANTGYSFSSWSGGASGSTNPVQVTMSGNKSVTANFALQRFTLTANANPASGGTVAQNPLPDPNDGKYTYGTVVTLTASANTGYSFNSWSGGASGSTNPVQVTMDGNKSVTANFTQLKYTLTLTASPMEGGSIQAVPAPDGEGKYAHGTVVTLTANANAGYSFGNWSGDASGSTNPVQVTMDGNRSVTANFTQLKYTLTLVASPTEGGSIQAVPAPDGEGKYAHGTVVTLTASANAGFSFANWSGDASGSTNPVQVTMDGNKSVTANFTQLKYTLTLTASPMEGGSIQAVPAPDGEGKYAHGTVVTLTASANAGFSFVNWSGDASGSTNPVQVTMDGNKFVTANFTQLKYTLTLTANPTEGGSIQAEPAPDGEGKYAYGTVVTLTASANAGYSFGNWSGDASGSTNPVQITMDGNKSVTANFTQLKYTLTLTASPTEGGSIQAEPAPDGEGKYAHGTVVTLTASANTGYSFGNWSGDAGGTTNPVQITMDGNKSVTANFTQQKYTLTLTASPTEGGSIQAEPAPDGEGKYAHGAVVTLTANANAGYSFGNWSGDAAGTTNPVQITMDGNKSVTANFTQLKYTLTLTANPTEGGSIQAEPAPDGEGKYAHGAVVTLTANANAGYSFANWSGDASGSTNPVQIMMDGNKSVTANFTQLKYTLTLAASPTEGGSIQAEPAPDGEGKYAHGTVVTLTANANAGYSFGNWSGDASGSTNPVQVTMDGNKSVTANFTSAGYTLTVTITAHPEWGYIQVEPNKASYAPNEIVTLTAVLTEDTKGWLGWTGGIDDANDIYRNPLTIAMTGNREVTTGFKCGAGVGQMLPLLGIGLVVLTLVGRRTRQRRQ